MTFILIKMCLTFLSRSLVSFSGLEEPSNNGSLRHHFRFHKEPFKPEFFKGPLPKEFFKEPIPSGHVTIHMLFDPYGNGPYR